MIRGTTPTLTFELPFSTELLDEAWVTLSQKKTEVINKELCDCAMNGNTLTVHLTQEETLQLDCDCITKIQIRCRHKDGNALASNIIEVPTEEILKDGVI